MLACRVGRTDTMVATCEVQLKSLRDAFAPDVKKARVYVTKSTDPDTPKPRWDEDFYVPLDQANCLIARDTVGPEGVSCTSFMQVHPKIAALPTICCIMLVFMPADECGDPGGAGGGRARSC
jgi:hypothetical protein